jgi:hypothetical protein
MWAFLLLWEALLVCSAVANNVSFTINLTWDYGAPDGFSRKMILINGTSPGPALLINQGDNVKVRIGAKYAPMLDSKTCSSRADSAS